MSCSLFTIGITEDPNGAALVVEEDGEGVEEEGGVDGGVSPETSSIVIVGSDFE
jgi:hypothetical protein